MAQTRVRAARLPRLVRKAQGAPLDVRETADAAARRRRRSRPLLERSGLASRLALLLCAALLLLAAPEARAVQPEEILEDPALEARAREISKGLRCVVCQNESIDESNADIAADMRVLVRERLVAGDTDDEVKAVLVSYYGEFILLKPRFSLANAAIWGLPLVAFLLGGVWYLRRTGRAGAAPAAAGETIEDKIEAPLSAEEQARLDRLLKT